MLILAPMQGLTELLFRKAYNRSFPGAFDSAVSPFLSLTHGNLKDAEKKIDDVLPWLNEGSMTVVPQLLGREVDEFIDLSNRLYELGYREINWNLGCPMRRVAGKHRGSGILPYPEEIREVLDGVVPKLKPTLSVKIRLGYRSPFEIDNIIPILNDYPLKDITIHPRIGKQMYSGIPDLERMGQILPLLKHKVIYNGDICSVYDYKRIRTLFPEIKDVMIGRGVLYNPLLPVMIRQQCAEDFPLDNTASNHTCSAGEFIVSLMNDIMALDVSQQAKVRKMKEYWCLFLKGVQGSEERKRKVLHADCLDDIFNLILEMTK